MPLAGGRNWTPEEVREVFETEPSHLLEVKSAEPAETRPVIQRVANDRGPHDKEH